MTKSVSRCLFLASIFLLAACASFTTSTPTQSVTVQPSAGDQFLVFGDITDDPGEVIEGTQPIADYVAAKLGEYGIMGGQVRVTSTTDEMIELLKNGEVDLYFDSTYPATLISDASGAQIILRRWKFGVETYHSVIFASKASGITSIDQLNGKMIAMDAPYSTSGFMLPAVYLTEHGLKLSGKPTSDAAVSAEEVGFAFAYDDSNVLQWVLGGMTPAGVTDNYNFDKAFPPEATAQLVELARTESTPRQVGLARAGLDPELLQAITQILLAMHEDPASQSALEKFQTTRFDEFPEGITTATNRIREMIDIVNTIPMP